MGIKRPADLQDAWATAPLPGPDAATPGVSLAGGASLVVFQSSRHKELAWKLIEFLSRPEQQVRFFELTGDLPAHQAAWSDPALTGNRRIHAFAQQLQRVVSTPKIPEWEQIATLVLERAHQIILGAAPADSALVWLDRDVARVLEKRRWLLEHGHLAAAGESAP